MGFNLAFKGLKFITLAVRKQISGLQVLPYEQCLKGK
jgi:hypothetical protein